MIKIVQNKLLAGLLILLAYSCSDKKWDNYYEKPDYLKEGSIMNVLEATSDFKEFSGLLRKTGYDSLLRTNIIFTVFAPKNGSFTGIDTTTDIAALKKIIGMHIVPKAAIYKDKMGTNFFLTASGKPARFNVTQNGGTVNRIEILSFDKRVLNGVLHEIGSVIMPLPNLYDFVLTNPDLLPYKKYIDSSYTQNVDLLKNRVIGYDSLGKPVYKLPIIYVIQSSYMSLIKIDTEKVVSTVFMPSATARNNLYSKMLAAREGNINLIIPKLNQKHGDTIIGNYFIAAKTAYKGDSAILMDYFYKNAVLKGEVTAFASGINSFKNLSGGTFVVDKAQILTDSTKYASNGSMYILNDITLPDSAYRRSFISQFRPMVNPTPALPNGSVSNPNITYRNGAAPNPTDNVSATYFGGRYTSFTFRAAYSAIDFKMPYVLKGNYKVILKTRVSGGAVMDAYYGTTKLTRFAGAVQEASSSRPIDAVLGIINVPVTGSVTITFVLVDNRQGSSFALSAIELAPVGP